MTTTLPLLLAYDGSVDARRALTWTADESLRTGVPVHVLAVDEIPPHDVGRHSGRWHDRRHRGLRPRLRRTARARPRRLLADAGVVDVTTEQRTGPVVAELVQASASASILVVGSRGHGAAGEALIGSVSQHLARHAACPVVVVREPRDPDARRIVVGIDGSRLERGSAGRTPAGAPR